MGCFYVRYSDDMLLLTDSKDQLIDILKQIQLRLQDLGLHLSERKTVLTNLQNGIEFLGYAFNNSGKSITEKAVRQLNEKLETLWLMNSHQTIDYRLGKMAQVLEGWEQYFRGNRQINDILEYVTVIYMVRNKGEAVNAADQRPEFNNIYDEIVSYLIGIWKKLNRYDLILLEFEQIYGLYALDKKKAIDEKYTGLLISQFEKIFLNAGRN